MVTGCQEPLPWGPSHQACPTPPEPGRFGQAGRLLRIAGRLLMSFRRGFAWSLVHLAIVASVLMLTTTLLPVSEVLREVAAQYEGGSTPVLEMKIPDMYGTYLQFMDGYMASDEDNAWSYLWDEWKGMFTEEDVQKVEAIEGVEVVVRVVTYQGTTEVTSEWGLERHNEWLQGILEGNSSIDQLRREMLIQYADDWNMSLTEYLDETGRFYRGCTVLGVELVKIEDWTLGFNEIVEGGLIEQDDGSMLLTHWWVGGEEEYTIGDDIRFIMGPYGNYNISGKLDWYDHRKICSFTVDGTIRGSNYVDAVMDLSQLLGMFEEVRHKRSAPLPLYTSLYIKATTPSDSQRVEERLNELFPGKRITRLGSAPVEVGETLKLIGARYGAIYNLSVIILGATLVMSQLAEAYASRREVWLLRARGWGHLDVLSFTLLRTALIGVLAGTISAILITVLLPVLPDFVFKMQLGSPEVASHVHEAISSTMAHPLWTLPMQGVTTMVTTGAFSIAYLLLTRPPRST